MKPSDSDLSDDRWRKTTVHSMTTRARSRIAKETSGGGPDHSRSRPARGPAELRPDIRASEDPARYLGQPELPDSQSHGLSD